MWISVTQATTFKDCSRKWYLKWRKKAPEVERNYLTFGTVLHGVVERFMKADNLGRDRKTGERVELYPPEWYVAVERDGRRSEITIPQRDLIQRLMNKAIEDGLLIRGEDVHIEEEMKLALLPESDGHEADLAIGFIDEYDSEGVTDNKSIGNWRYALGPKALAKDFQLLIYATWWCVLRERQGKPLPEKIRLRHRQWSKDPEDPKVRHVVAYVTPQEVRDCWDELVVIAKKMRSTSEIADWTDVPPATPESGVCNKYGGCQFMTLCTGQETLEKYVERVLKVNRSKLSSESNLKNHTAAVAETNGSKESNHEKEKPMDKPMTFAEKMAARRAQQSLSSAPTTPAPTGGNAPATKQVETPAAKPAQAAPAADSETPPWAKPNCGACGGKGFNSKGNVCRICDSSAEMEGRPPSRRFEIVTLGDGRAVWEEKDTAAVKGSAPVKGGDTPVKTSEKEATEAPTQTLDRVFDGAKAPESAPAAKETKPAQESKASTKAAPAKTEAQEQPAEAAEDVEASTKTGQKPGRPKKGFTLCVNCGPDRGPVIRFEAYLLNLRRELAEAAGKGSYHEFDPFKARDLLCKKLEEHVAENLWGASIVQVMTDDPDTRSMMPILRAAAGTIIE